jgi:glyoxylase-like metal-dependent hydrolase (beta-lactamase superfamily II)
MRIHTIPGLGMGSNCFLIDNGGEHALVDSSMDESAELIIQTLAEILGGEGLDALVLTHRHIDHVGGAAAIVRKFGCEVMMHEKDAGALIEGDQVSTGAAMFGGDVAPLNVRKLDEGDSIAGFDVIHTPGHTSGSMCLYDSKSKTLVSGDTVFREGVGRWDFPTGDGGELADSVARLSKLKVEGLYPGHGDIAEAGGSRFIADNLRYLRMLGGLE